MLCCTAGTGSSSQGYDTGNLYWVVQLVLGLADKGMILVIYALVVQLV